MEVPKQRSSARLHEALARDPELNENLSALWKVLPEEYKAMAIKVYGDVIFELLPREWAYRIFECGWSWVETYMNDRFEQRKLEQEREHLRAAKQTLSAIRKKLRELKEAEHARS